MPAKRYKLKPHAAPYARPKAGGAPEFKFRVRFGQSVPEGERIAGLSRSPVISMRLNEVIQTTNELAQFFLERMTAPNNTFRGIGGAPPINRVGGLLLEDVTATEPSFDVDLDALLPAS